MRDGNPSRYDDSELRQMSREELEGLLEDVLFRLRQMDSADMKQEILTKSQTLRLFTAKKN